MNSRLPELFRGFAGPECRETSPLYAYLTLATVDDAEILAIAAEASPGQPVPNLLFAAVHYLLVAGPAHRLANITRPAP